MAHTVIPAEVESWPYGVTLWLNVIYCLHKIMPFFIMTLLYYDYLAALLLMIPPRAVVLYHMISLDCAIPILLFPAT